MLCAPTPHSLRGYGLIRTNDTINGMTLEQLRTGILQGCLSGRLAVPYVALIDFTMHHPFRHCLSRARHEADAIFHDNPQRKGFSWISFSPPALSEGRHCCFARRDVTVGRPA